MRSSARGLQLQYTGLKWSATCFHVELQQFSACFRIARLSQRQLGFLAFLFNTVLIACQVPAGLTVGLHRKQKLVCLISYAFTPHLIMGQVFTVLTRDLLASDIIERLSA